MCDDCIKEIASALNYSCRAILSVLNKPMNKNQVMIVAKLSYAIASQSFQMLESCKLIEYEEYGRSKIVKLTENGKRLLELYKEVKR